MISQKNNRVQAIKNKFENLNNEKEQLLVRKSSTQLSKQRIIHKSGDDQVFVNDIDLNEPKAANESIFINVSPTPNSSYLYSRTDGKQNETRKILTRQSSDPGKKLHRSHAFRCDRSQKINHSPKRHGSCNGRSESSDFSVKMGERKLSREKLKMLGNFIEDQMRKENFVLPTVKIVGVVADLQPAITPNKDIPQHILDQYATVVKTKKKDEKQEAMTDSGVSSETENLEDEKNAKIKKLMSNFEKTEPETDSNLEEMNDLCASSETMRLERKNPHLILTATLKKALKQPLPAGPPPKKPPRSFTSPTPEHPENQKKDAKKMLEKLEQVLQKREAQKEPERIYDVAETDLSVKKSKEMHYLCTEILDITQRTLLPNQCNNTSHSLAGCFNSLNCAVLSNSTASLPYTRLMSRPNSNIEPACSCSDNSLESNTKRFSTFLSNSQEKCTDCKENEEKPGFKSHLNCNCGIIDKPNLFVEPEHIYDEPCVEVNPNTRRSQYGTLNSLKINGYSKSLEDLRSKVNEEEKIYDIPYDVSATEPPEFSTSSPKTDFQKLREAFESGNPKTDTKEPSTIGKISVTKQRSMDHEKRTFGTEIYDNKKVASIPEVKRGIEKPPLTPKPNVYVKKISKSTEDLIDSTASRILERRFNTETKRYRNRTDTGTSVKRNAQVDLDRENLNRLMDEIYDTVTAACNMENKKPSSFPIDQSDGSTSEESVKLTRSLTETRKNYVRRVSSRLARLDQNNVKRVQRYRHQTSVCSYKSEIVDNPYSTFRSWKSFRASRTTLNKTNMSDITDPNIDTSGSTASLDDLDSDSVGAQSIDEKTACVDIQLPFEVRERGLFNVCLLVGLDYLAGQAYVKSVFPSQVKLPPHIENLIFPETLNEASKREWIADASGGQCYSLVLTDDKGERSYGYCRRVLPEGASTCLPLCYCLIGKYRAPGFYYKVLQEIESHHGSSEVQRNSVLQQLFEMDFPNPGEELKVTYKINSSVANVSDEKAKSKTMPDHRRHNIFEPCDDSNELANVSNAPADVSNKLANGSNEVDSSLRPGHGSVFYDNLRGYEEPRYMDLENNNGPKKVMISLQNVRTKVIKRPIDPRVDEDNLSTLLDSFGAGLVLKVFGSLLLERKVVIVSDKLSVVSSCMEALQSVLYPFVWQQPLIATIPEDIQDDMLEAPLPMLAGMLKTSALDNVNGITFEENGMLIDLTNPSKVLFYKGDESTILPTSSYKALKTSLQMESYKHKDRTEDSKTRNLMISEAFLRFFIEILGDFWKYFSVGELKEGSFGKNNVVFDKEQYIKNSHSKQIQFFLEWFTETAMFNHFIQNMCLRYSPERGLAYNLVKDEDDLVDTPLPDFYELLDDRMLSRQDSVTKNVEKSNYKNAVNKKMKILKTKLRDLIN